MPHTPQHRAPTANPISRNQVLRRQARLNQQGQSPNVAAINVANLGQQTGGFSPQVRPVARAISQGTTVPQMRQQNLDNRQIRANTALTNAQAGQVGGLNRTNLRIARQVPRAAQITGQFGVDKQALANEGNQAVEVQRGLNAENLQGVVDRGAMDRLGITDATAQRGQDLTLEGLRLGVEATNAANIAKSQMSDNLARLEQQGKLDIADREVLTAIMSDESLSPDERLDLAIESGVDARIAQSELAAFFGSVGRSVVSKFNGGDPNPQAQQASPFVQQQQDRLNRQRAFEESQTLAGFAERLDSSQSRMESPTMQQTIASGRGMPITRTVPNVVTQQDIDRAKRLEQGVFDRASQIAPLVNQ